MGAEREHAISLAGCGTAPIASRARAPRPEYSERYGTETAIGSGTTGRGTPRRSGMYHWCSQVRQINRTAPTAGGHAWRTVGWPHASQCVRTRRTMRGGAFEGDGSVGRKNGSTAMTPQL